MSESYSGGEASSSERAPTRDLIARLIPSAEAELLVTGFLAERASPEGMRPKGAAIASERETDLDPAAREVSRVRRQLALSESARGAQHSLSDPVTALLADAQLSDPEPLAEAHLRAVGRIVEPAGRWRRPVVGWMTPPHEGYLPASGAGTKFARPKEWVARIVSCGDTRDICRPDRVRRPVDK